MARSCAPGSDSPPRHTQSSPSLAANASTSMRTSHSGASLRKTLQRCRAPQSARMFSVLPRIEQLFAAPVRKRNIVRPVENKFERIPVGSRGAVEEPIHRCGILRLDPSQCLRAFPLFKPEIGIIVRRFDSRSYIDDRHRRLPDWATMQAADGSDRLEIADTGNPGKPLRPEAVSQHVQLTPFVFGAANVKRRGKAGASWQDNPASKPISNSRSSEACFWPLAANHCRAVAADRGLGRLAGAARRCHTCRQARRQRPG